MSMMFAGWRLSGFLVLMILWGGEGSAQNVRKGPYLIFQGDNTGMTALWQDDGTSRRPASLGSPDTSMANGPFPSVEYGTDHQHQYQFPGLSPGQRYWYEVQAGTVLYTGSSPPLRLTPPDPPAFLHTGISVHTLRITARWLPAWTRCLLPTRRGRRWSSGLGDLVSSGTRRIPGPTSCSTGTTRPS